MYSLLSFTKEDFMLIPVEFWIGLVISFIVIYGLVYKHFSKNFIQKQLEDENEEER